MGFRFTAQDIAQGLGVSGWVRNLGNGKVEVMAEAGEATLKDFLARINLQFGRYIRDADIAWEEATGEFADFNITF